MAEENNNAVPPMEETTATSNPPPPLPTIPFDLMVEILCRLPVKSLLQLRCVCKSWNSLISDPEFAKKHLRCSPKDFSRHHIISNHKVNPKPLNSSPNFDKNVLMAYPLQSVFNAAVPAAAPTTLHEFRVYNPNQFDVIVGSCDGIVCLDIDQSSPLLWNPSIRRFKKLPSLEKPPLKWEDDVGGSFTTFGFGYDHFADRYKVVAVFCYECDYEYSDVNDDRDYNTLVKVFTLGTDSWRSIQEFPLGVPSTESGKFVSGTLNWLSMSYNFTHNVVVSFDLGKESYQEVFLPVGAQEVWGLGVLRDCLCIISYLDNAADIWIMKEYGNKDSWTNLFRMKRMGLDLLYSNLLHSSEDDEVLLLELKRELVLYNSRDATFKTLQIQNMDGQMDSKVYVESLVSPCSL